MSAKIELEHSMEGRTMMAHDLTSPMDVARAIRMQRTSLGLTQQQTADAAGVSRKLVADIEAGHPRAELAKLLQILLALGLSLTARSAETENAARLQLRGADDLNPRTRDYEAIFGYLLKKQDYEFALKQLAEYVTASLAEEQPLLQNRPSLASPEWVAALAGATDYVARRLGQDSPAWTAVPRLGFPWFVAESYRPVGDKMKELTKQQTPPELAHLNVYIRERGLINA
ncbi:helix-turn-helix domain-containing protein [Paenarthrobacter sp. NPDC058040]|uniref:helix-turn-helix domain-containing protein n=1 Tax=unclassified Paenarthrobacter TaxID=2634190 RepID=UPI0036DBAD3D